MDDAGIVWWLWAILGLFLAALELGTGGFYLLFFGAGALLVALLTALGFISDALPQLLWFTALSVTSSLLFRRRLIQVFTPKALAAGLDSLIGETAVALDDIAPGTVGKVELRGSAWSAHNAGSSQVARGQRCVVERVDGLSLWITASQER